MLAAPDPWADAVHQRHLALLWLPVAVVALPHESLDWLSIVHVELHADAPPPLLIPTASFADLHAAQRERVVCAWDLPQLDPKAPPRFGIDAAVLARAWAPVRDLREACAVYRTEPPTEDSAEGEAMAVAMLLPALFRRAPPDWRTVGDLYQWQVGAAREQEAAAVAFATAHNLPAPPTPWTDRMPLEAR